MASVTSNESSFFFALHLEWPLNLITDEKSNAICILANLCATLFSLRFRFSSAWFYFLSKCTKKRAKLNRENNQHYLTSGVGVKPILKKNCSPFALFPFINTPTQMMKLRFLYIPLTSFYYNPPFCPPNPLLINHILYGKVKSSLRV